ncbi:hypothetical protein BKH46_00280 [Helicobacter sp. 12S02634-8]|uniref:gluconate 2-dehydrogenase subunit 3 family protein n=1 Tax=Helicobacter sp. 12S02634-8 TaxID=1476199 RepID=UPI000BA744BE|nr:gluconate 2-dehydrogenase subunit 3 family protein [Helicobacter sp. 12S02634-8]PAF48386.1 hypothetical protein BKH46_00280 [Helicobacter sp. 12S02634-8]
MEHENKITRRSFLKTSTFVATAVLGSGVMGNAAEHKHSTNPTPKSKDSTNTEKYRQARGRMFFTKDEDFQVLSAATERIFPADELGEGSIALGVPYFIDNQLAGAYGNNIREYMQGPFSKGEPTQGYQTPMIRQEIFLEGVHCIQRESKKRFKKNFPDLNPKEQDKILHDFEADKVAMEGVEASYFFSLLREMTLCGVYADPIYSGNDGMKGWKMKEFPGAQMSYLAFITDEKFQKIPPMSLSDMEGGM